MSTDNRRKLMALLITTLLFIGISGILFFNNHALKTKINDQHEQLDSLAYFRDHLKLELKTIREELNTYKGKSAELDQLLNEANRAIEEKEIRIKQLSRDHAEVKRLKAELADLKKLRDQYLKRIEELEALLAEKTRENENLQQQNKDLVVKVGKLEQQNAELDKKVQLASVLQTGNVIIIGEKKGKGGKYVPSKLHKAERLLITFEVNENKVATPGERIIYVRVAKPDGTLIQNKQSGSFTNTDKNLSMEYTQSQKINYNNAQQRVTTAIELEGHQWAKGTYVAEFYCNGYFCGSKKITLK